MRRKTSRKTAVRKKTTARAKTGRKVVRKTKRTTRAKAAGRKVARKTKRTTSKTKKVGTRKRRAGRPRKKA